MPLFQFSVIVPYALDGDAADAKTSVQIEVAAASPSEALPIAQVLAAAFVRMRHPGRRATIQNQGLSAGAASSAVPGLYLHVLTSRFRIELLSFPAQIDREGARQVLNALNTLEERNLYGVIADCAGLTHLGLEGLAVFKSVAQRVRLRLVRPNPEIRQAVVTSGVGQAVPSFPDLAKALGDLTAKWMQVATTNLV